ncbi:radical SAM protein [Thermoanaerobacterium butyriciformans]|uniref:Pyruvate formate lyase activating enzyme n=1 Tax=Thermoanaerobacterium butyriciformans TaxID=1702242 RepID=A0ABS4NDN8_9THEO|nr:radical SAM protein [Thermoanaerobacterium butyriciformans]MBP2071110.1 putative pyruvate formate lyase activating enzyme [Thermoanaerobacterium butyriciformans]
MESQVCNICPRNCNIDRSTKVGFCGMSSEIHVAKAYLHEWEEPCISGSRGSGTVFFTGCNLRCVFCQNYKISQENFGVSISPEKLVDIFINLEKTGAHNINLVTPTIFVPKIKEAIIIARNNGLSIPIVYNSNAYESVESLRSLEGLIDIYLPDLKYYSDEVAVKYSNAPHYFEYATKAILEMYRQVGNPVFDSDGIMKKGIIIRHLILPGKLDETKRILKWIKDNLSNEVYVSLMGQYTPFYNANKYQELNRRISNREYEEAIEYFFEIGLENGFVQDDESASESFIPDFDLEGIL